MSYILDALKKSDQQRSRITMSDEAPAYVAQETSGTFRYGLPLILLIIALATGWFFIYFQRPAIHQTLPSATEPAPETISPTTQVPLKKADHHKGSIRTPGLHQNQLANGAPEVSRTPLAEQHANHVPINIPESNTSMPNITKPGTTTSEQLPVFKPITPVSPVSRANAQISEMPDNHAQVSAAESGISSLKDLPVSVQQSLPTINIEGHIYDDNPAARMVIINGKIRREKQSLGAMLKLEEITPNGVILSYQGHVFHMGVFER